MISDELKESEKTIGDIAKQLNVLSSIIENESEKIRNIFKQMKCSSCEGPLFDGCTYDTVYCEECRDTSNINNYPY